MEAIIAQLEQLNLEDVCPPQTPKVNIAELSKMTLHLYKENIALKNEIKRLRSSLTIIEHIHIPKWIT
tara:strand:- start:9950 stop:10153 length:204 start_codon:yes stop_codon:yes gene_type:complete